MSTTQDCSIGISATEASYGTNTTATRWYEFTDETFDFRKNIKQATGLRVGSRVDRALRRTIPTADAGGDFTTECISKGMGLLWQACLGSGTSTLVSGTTYQQVFTLGDNPGSVTLQKGVVEAGLTVDAYTFIGGMVDSWELSCPNGDIVTLKVTFDFKDVTTATGYASPSYTSGANVFSFEDGSIASGTLTAPTTTALASGSSSLANVRSFNLKCENNLKTDRYNFGGSGRKAKPTVGKRVITGNVVLEYDSTTARDAVLNDTASLLILNFAGGALSTGNEQLQVVLPATYNDNELPKSNAGDLITQSMNIQVLDNLTAAQPIWVVCRTADNAL